MRPERAPRPSLGSVQAALLSRITGQELGAPELTTTSLIHGDARASAEERLAVYSFMYGARLVEALASQFPRLAHLLGAEAFADLTAEYVAERPSRHPSLRELGRALPGWLAAQRPDAPALASLAALEWARADVYDLADEPAMTLDAPRAFPSERFGELPLKLIAAHRFVAVDWRDRGVVGRARAKRGRSPEPALRVERGQSRRHIARLAPRDRRLSPRRRSGGAGGARDGFSRQPVRRRSATRSSRRMVMRPPRRGRLPGSRPGSRTAC